jgi:hypothetical protein
VVVFEVVEVLDEVDEEFEGTLDGVVVLEVVAVVELEVVAAVELEVVVAVELEVVAVVELELLGGACS